MVLGLTLAGGGLALPLGGWGWSGGILLGGFLSAFNLLGTEKAVRAFLGEKVPNPWPVALAYPFKLAVAGGVAALALWTGRISGAGLLVGLTALPLGAVLERILIPGGAGAEKEP